jgi:cytochrome c peroxidase
MGVRKNNMSPLKNTTLVLALSAAAFLGCNKPKEAAPAEEKSPAQAETKPEEKKPSGKYVDSLTFTTIGEMPIPKDNPQTAEKITLGHQLFFEKRLSVDGSVSCYSCHQNENGNGGATPTAIGAQEKKLTRHSPVIWNVGHLPAHYWDGRAPNLEAQAKGAWGGGNMGVGADNLDKKAKEIAALPEYKELFKKAFPEEEPSADVVAKAISSYERTLVCNDTAYDKYAAGDKTALTDEQKDGLELFMGKAMCTACHAPPFFSTAYMGKGTFFNVGIGIEGVDEKDVDVGRMKVTEDEKDWAAFKPPSLRNVTQSAPYFHEGHAETLKSAVKFMASGGYDNKNKSPLMTDKKLSDPEIDLLVAFLGSLECGGKLEEPAPPKAK